MAATRSPAPGCPRPRGLPGRPRLLRPGPGRAGTASRDDPIDDGGLHQQVVQSRRSHRRPVPRGAGLFICLACAAIASWVDVHLVVFVSPQRVPVPPWSSGPYSLPCHFPQGASAMSVRVWVQPQENSPSGSPRGAFSCSIQWRARRDSNSRPSGPQPDALSTELRAPRKEMAEREGFEPSKQVTPLTGLANRRTRPLCDLSSSAERW